MTQSIEGLLPRLEPLGEVAKQHKSLQFDNLLHHLNLALLLKAFTHLNRRAAEGVDNIGWFDYQVNSEHKLASLYQRIQSDCYKAKPVKRIWIAKWDGSERPISITSFEDKIVQQAVIWLLEPIYESMFLRFSYGFRPSRNQH